MSSIQPDINSLRWDAAGLMPAIVQDARSGEVRMLGYVSRESLQMTIDTGYMHFYSRSRQSIWKKGETSGNTLEVVDVRADCDGDTLLVRAIPHGPTCHTGQESCFYQTALYASGVTVSGPEIMQRVADVVADRQREMPEGSYTTYLFEQGIDKIGKKIGEESAEVIIAAKNGDPQPLAGEAADLLYHLLVLLRASDVELSEVWKVLEDRHVQVKPSLDS